MVESYIIGSDPKQPKAPEVFESQKLADGTWIASYKVENNEVWNMVKSGEFYGFSVEGMFGIKEAKIKKADKMKKSKRNLFGLFFGTNREQFAEATTVEGVTVFYEGELAEGTLVQVIVDGEMMPAPAGDHQIMLSETESVVITLDDTGVITAVEAVEAETEMETETVNAGELKEFAVQFKDEINAKFAAQDKIINDLKAQIKALESGNKFQSQTRKTNPTEGAGFKKLLNKNTK
jgi:archaellum component FlaF (FlaF/FlaG flagellin family)